MRLGVDGHRAGANLGGDGVDGLPFASDQLDQGQGSVTAVGTEGQARAGIVACRIRPLADRGAWRSLSSL